jgi:Protein of unknown function (DUF2630)
MDDAAILKRIETMVDEERELRERKASGGMPDDAHARLEALEVGLDQAWDLLRQRRALREFGEDPNEAHTRDAKTVESFEQ